MHGRTEVALDEGELEPLSACSACAEDHIRGVSGHGQARNTGIVNAVLHGRTLSCLFLFTETVLPTTYTWQ